MEELMEQKRISSLRRLRSYRPAKRETTALTEA